MKQAYLADAVTGRSAIDWCGQRRQPVGRRPGEQRRGDGARRLCHVPDIHGAGERSSEGGLTPDVDVLTQVRDAVQAMIDASAGLDTTAGDARYLRQNRAEPRRRGQRGHFAGEHRRLARSHNPTFTGSPRAPTPPAGNDSHAPRNDRVRWRCGRDNNRAWGLT